MGDREYFVAVELVDAVRFIYHSAQEGRVHVLPVDPQLQNAQSSLLYVKQKQLYSFSSYKLNLSSF